MRRVSYSSVLAKALQRAVAQSTGSVDLAGSMSVFINQWAAAYWDRVFWPEWSPVERRQFRDTYASGTSYAVGVPGAAVEVYFPATDRYYQSLHAANLGNAPATLSGGTYVENSAHWAESVWSYTVSDWAASTPYALGNKVRNPSDGYNYQCITAHTSGGSFNAANFGLLTDFVRNISLTQTSKTEIGVVEGAYDADPTVSIDANRIRFRLESVGIIVRGDLQRPFIRFRKVCPSWTGSVWASTTAFVVGDQAYYSTTGDYYTCIQGNTAQAPTTAAYWTRIDFPYLLRDAVSQAAYAEWLKGDGQNEKADAEQGRAEGMILREIDIFERQQGQTKQLPFKRS